ncbi:MAG: hypothetical protein HYU81_00490 [Candidatus Brennerbacteria bacterium]|nr:hypothetical protein [Candidatus Brennerbacteria bacterium]
MERTFAVLLGISFVGIALFGFSVASAPPAGGVGGTHVGCVADMFEELQGNTCPVTDTPFALLASHLNSLRTFVGGVTVWLLVLLMLAFFALIFSSTHVTPLLRSLAPIRVSKIISSRTSAKHIRWIALHEASPTLVR